MKKIVLMFAMVLFINQMIYSTPYKGVESPGFIKGADLVYKDPYTVTIRTGYGNCNGKNWQITSEADLNLDNINVLSGGIPYSEGFIYIYIDYSEVEWSNALVINDQEGTDVIGSVTAPLWSDDKQGWYNGDDRCIGVVWSPAGTNTIQSFCCIDGNKYLCDIKRVQDDGCPNSIWQECEEYEENYTPVNTIAIYIAAGNSDTADHVRVCVAPYESPLENLTTAGYAEATSNGWLYIQRGWTRK
ncbi:MAG: hypothetical protein ACD_79C01302G0021 [uncultured bacterium]|nr:MAG: hypothetical protein ACD_79C01302G0021 [uncultured bacterium]